MRKQQYIHEQAMTFGSEEAVAAEVSVVAQVRRSAMVNSWARPVSPVAYLTREPARETKQETQ